MTKLRITDGADNVHSLKNFPEDNLNNEMLGERFKMGDDLTYMSAIKPASLDSCDELERNMRRA